MFDPFCTFLLLNYIAATAAQKQWTKLPAIGQGARQEHSTVALGDRSIWVLGGTSPDASGQVPTVDRVEFYNLKNGTWHTAAPLLRPLNHLNAAAVGHKLFVVGGLSGGSDWLADGIAMAYSPSTDSWTQRASMPKGTARGACAVGVYKNKIYLAGGQNYIMLTKQGDQNALRGVSAYDTDTDSWEKLPPIPQPRQHVAGVVVDSTFYVIGGRENGQYKVQNSTYALNLEDPASGWRELAALPTARGGLACDAIGPRIYCFGGEGNADSSDGMFDEVEVYDTRTDRWTSLAPMPVPRHGWGVAAIGDTIYVPGGGLRAGTMPTDYFDAFTPGG